jgi:hypothetical protein
MVHALTSSHPKRHYHIGLDAHVILALRELFPEWFFCQLFRLVCGPRRWLQTAHARTTAYLSA